MTSDAREPSRIGPLIDALLAERGCLAVCREEDVRRRWPELVGERIAAVAECVSVERGIVCVRVASAPWRNELAYLKPMLLARLRAECETITDIVLC